MSTGFERTMGGELASGSPTTRAQAAAVQVGSIRPAFSQRARCGSQHLQLSTPPHLPIHTAELPSRQRLPVPQPNVVNGRLVGLECLESEALFHWEGFDRDL